MRLEKEIKINGITASLNIELNEEEVKNALKSRGYKQNEKNILSFKEEFENLDLTQSLELILNDGGFTITDAVFEGNIQLEEI